MEKEDVNAAGPIELLTVESVLEYQKKYATEIQITDKEAEIILNYLEGHDYVIGHVNGALFRGDINDKVGETIWEEYGMDDVIDLVCEWNYELILEIEAERQNAMDFIRFGNVQNNYNHLKLEEAVLDSLYEKTKYGKQIDELAVQLADELIAKVSMGKDISGVVERITTALTPQKQSGRVR